MKIQEVQISTDGSWAAMASCGGNWQYAGITVSAADSGAVSLRSDSPVSKLRVIFEKYPLSGALVLGDAWERAYGDLQWHAPDDEVRMPWYFFAFDGCRTHCFGVKTQPNALCFWQFDGETPILTMDVRSGTNPLALQGELEVCTVVSAVLDGDVHEACAAFCRMLCDNPRIVSRPIFGGNDWYCNYGDNSFEKIRLHARRIAGCAEGCPWKPYMVIDDGWQICHRDLPQPYGNYNGGPWGYCNANFADMKAMAEEIVAAGAIPGIWFRPLETLEKLPKYYYLDRDFPNLTLDSSVPEVLELVKRDVRTIVSWGYKLIKHDFSSADIFGKWGFEMKDGMFYGKASFADRTKTTAQIIKNFYLAIREAAGDDVLIMGCNTFSHLSAGIMDIQRTGDDTSGRDWERTKVYGINTLAFRMMQHGAFYCVDADCVGITRDVAWEKNSQWLDVLAKSGTPLFISIAQDAFSPEVEDAIRRAFRHACACRNVSVPLDWMESRTPQDWKSDHGTDHYRW